MWLINWLIDHASQVVDIVSNWYQRIKRICVDLYSHTVTAMDYYWSWFAEIVIENGAKVVLICVEWATLIYDLARRWYSAIKYICVTLYNKIVNVVVDWFDKIRIVCVEWFSNLRTLVENWWSNLTDLISRWYGNIKTIVTDWFSKIRDLVTTWYNNIKTVVIDWFNNLKNLAVSWINNIKFVVVDFFNNLKYLIKDKFPTLFNFLDDPGGFFKSMILLVIEDIFKPLVDLFVNWLFGLWGDDK